MFDRGQEDVCVGRFEASLTLSSSISTRSGICFLTVCFLTAKPPGLCWLGGKGQRPVCSYLSSTRLILHVVSRSDLGADILQVRGGCIDGPGMARCTRNRRLLLHRGLLGHRRFGDDPAAVGVFTISGGGGGGGRGSGSRTTGC